MLAPFLLLIALGLCSLTSPDLDHQAAPHTVTNLSLKIASSTLQFDRLVRDVNAVLIAGLKQIDTDPNAIESQKARQILTELHAEFSELERQSRRLCRDDFGKEFVKMFQSGTGNLEAFIRTTNGRLLSLFKLAARSEAQFQALLSELRHSRSESDHSKESADFFESLLQGHWRILAIAVLSCFLLFPWRSAVVHSVLLVVLYALVLQYLQSIDNTATSFVKEFMRFRNMGWSGTFLGTFKNVFRFRKTSIRNVLFSTASSFENLRQIRQTISTDFDLLVKGIDISLRREKTLLSHLESMTSPNDFDRQRVIDLMRNNPFRVPKMQFDDLRQRSEDKSIVAIMDAADRLQTRAFEASDSMYNVLSGGLESILTAEAVINQARILSDQGKFSEAAELASIVAAKYSHLSTTFTDVLDDLHHVQGEFESVQSARNAIVKKYRRKKLSSGLMLTASVAAVVSGFSLPLIGTMGTTAISAATAGSATVSMLTSDNVLSELQHFGDDLGGFREALSKIRQMVIGSMNQLGAVSDLLLLAEGDLRDLQLQYEPVDSRVRSGLDLFFKQALEEQVELIALLKIVPNKKPVRLDIIGNKS